MEHESIDAIALHSRQGHRNIDEIYRRMEPAQRAYFDQQRIGPYAPYNEPSGAWPDKAAIRDVILKKWGSDSPAMHYFTEVFKLSYDKKNNTVSGNETIWPFYF